MTPAYQHPARHCPLHSGRMSFKLLSGRVLWTSWWCNNSVVLFMVRRSFHLFAVHPALTQSLQDLRPLRRIMRVASLVPFRRQVSHSQHQLGVSYDE